MGEFPAVPMFVLPDLALFDDVGPHSIDALFTASDAGLARWRAVGETWERTGIAGGWVDAQAVSTWSDGTSPFTWVGVLESDGATVHAMLRLVPGPCRG